MKIQLNKLGREFMDLAPLKKSLESKYRLPYYCVIEEDKYDKSRVGYFCCHCGIEFFGAWKSNYLKLKHATLDCRYCEPKKPCEVLEETLKEEHDKVRSLIMGCYEEERIALARLTHCPVCGAELRRERGFFFADSLFLPKDINIPDYCGYEVNYKREFGLLDKEEIEETIEQKINQLVSTYDIPTTASNASDKSENVLSTPTGLKDYIRHLIEMEMGIYSLTKRLKSLYIQRVLSERNVVASKYLPEYEKKDEIAVAELQFQQWEAKKWQYKKGEIGIPLPVKPTPPILATPTFFNKKKVLAENEALQNKYQADLEIYNNNVKRYETEKERLISIAENEAQELKTAIEKLKKELDRMSQSNDLAISAITAKNVVDKEVEEAETLLKKLYECRNALYGYNIIFGKYRNVVALSTFYEYLMAGRCTTLDGADGTYNLYENEIRADMIIGQLSQVIEKLDEIKDTQYMIYSELQTVNRSLANLNKTMDTALVSIQNMEKDVANISANTDVIAHNSAVTAYYSKINAELTNALGYMVAFK